MKIENQSGFLGVATTEKDGCCEKHRTYYNRPHFEGCHPVVGYTGIEYAEDKLVLS